MGKLDERALADVGRILCRQAVLPGCNIATVLTAWPPEQKDLFVVVVLFGRDAELRLLRRSYRIISWLRKSVELRGWHENFVFSTSLPLPPGGMRHDLASLFAHKKFRLH